MPLTATPLPFGLRDVAVFAYSGTTPSSTGIDLPNARTLSFSETEDFQELRGDDGVVAVHGSGAAVDWSLESGGVPLEAIVVMYGGAITSSGVSPNQVKTYKKKGTDARPYFKVEGQAISDSGGDFHVVLWKCKATGELSGEMADGAFWLTGASGRATPLTTAVTGPPAGALGEVYQFVQNETETAIDITP